MCMVYKIISENPHNRNSEIKLLSVPCRVLIRIILERMKETVDLMLWVQQAELRLSRLCADNIASLRIIVEQSFA